MVQLTTNVSWMKWFTKAVVDLSCCAMSYRRANHLLSTCERHTEIATIRHAELFNGQFMVYSYSS